MVRNSAEYADAMERIVLVGGDEIRAAHDLLWEEACRLAVEPATAVVLCGANSA